MSSILEFMKEENLVYPLKFGGVLLVYGKIARHIRQEYLADSKQAREQTIANG